MGWLLNRRLASSVHVGDLEDVRHLLTKGANPNALDRFRNPLLLIACGKNFYDIAELLVAAGANVNAAAGERKHKGCRALHFAACANSLYYVALLLRHGASVNAKNAQGQTALDWAVGNPWGISGRIIDYLRKHGATGSIPTDILDAACEEQIASDQLVAQRFDIRTRESLLDGDEDDSDDDDDELADFDTGVNAVDRTAPAVPERPHCDDILSAAEAGDLAVVSDILAKHPSHAHAANKYGWSVLHKAVTGGNIEIVKTLLAHGVDPNVRSGTEETPLHCISSKASVELVELLLSAGADVNATDYGDHSVLHSARYASADIISLLLQNGANVHHFDCLGKPILQSAAFYGATELARQLIEHGADVNVRSTDDDSTPLHSAASRNHVAIVELLIGNGAEINARTDHGDTPFKWADYSSPEAADVLRKAGATL